MRVLITGGSGFLGARLACSLLQRGSICGQTLENLLLVDLYPPPATLRSDPRVRYAAGDLMEQSEQRCEEHFDIIFHLAAAVSGESEKNFELGMRSNFDATRSLLETLRHSGCSPRFVFASSVAVFGAEPMIPLPAVVRDNTLPVPQSSYGIQKFLCEQLVADYTRKGFVDGRTLRLMTVAVRPGESNAAASSFLSGIIREPLHGKAALCPVPLDTAVALASPARTIDALLRVAEADRESLGGRTAINMPALSVTVGEMLEALEEAGGSAARSRLILQPDDGIARIVGSWPARFESVRAERLGLLPDPDFRSIVAQFLKENSCTRSWLAAGATY